MYISKQLQYKTRNDISINVENGIETSFIEICTYKGKNIIVGTIYRPPNNKIDTFENSMKRILEKIDKENKIGYLMGDFNIDLLKSESCDYACRPIYRATFHIFLLSTHNKANKNNRSHCNTY